MQRLEVSGVVRPIYGSLGVKGLRIKTHVRIRNTYFFHCNNAYADGPQYYVYSTLPVLFIKHLLLIRNIPFLYKHLVRRTVLI